MSEVALITKGNSMEYENMLRQFLGDKAYNTEGGQFGSGMIKNIKQCLVKATGAIDKIDTETRHKELMLREVSVIESILKSKVIDEKALRRIIFHFITLMSKLLGFDRQTGRRFRNVAYYQTEGQYYYEQQLMGGDIMQSYIDKKNLVCIRKKVYNFLKNDGCSDLKISQVMNISEYEVKKIKNVLMIEN